MIKRIIKKSFIIAFFNVGVNIIGIPETIYHSFNYEIKERNIRQRYSY